MTNPAAAYGAFRNAVDAFELSLDKALDDLRDAEAKASAVPGLTIPPDLRERISAFRSASAVGLSAFLPTAVDQYKAA